MAGNSFSALATGNRGESITTPKSRAEQLRHQERQASNARSDALSSTIGDTMPNARWHEMTGYRKFSGTQARQILDDGFTLIADRPASNNMWFPHRDNPSAWTDRETARHVSQSLSHLAEYSERHDGIGPKLITAIMRNEQTYYHSVKDGWIDGLVKHTGEFPHNPSVGPAQMQLENIKILAKKYPALFDSLNGKELSKFATTKGTATALVGAYLDDRVQTLQDWSKHRPDRAKLNHDEKLLYDNCLPLWKSGQETKALIMSFNPAGGKDHLNNVFHQLSLIEKGQ